MTKSKIATRVIVQANNDFIPKKANVNDAAYDLYTEKEIEVQSNTRCYIPLGFKIALPANMAMIIQPRSGQSGKGMIAKARTPKWLKWLFVDEIPLRINADSMIGLIDSGFGEGVQAIVKVGQLRMKHRIMQILGFKIIIAKHSRICQGRFVYVPSVDLASGTVTGKRSGLGSTDK